MRWAFWMWATTLVVGAAIEVAADSLRPGPNVIVLRTQAQTVHYLPGQDGSARGRAVLFLPGDRGWHGFAIDVAQAMADWGYEVYGLDTRRYLESFTGWTALTADDVARDLVELGRRVGATPQHPITLVGWSEGAGLAVLGASGPDRGALAGVLVFGLARRTVLGWRLRDDLTWITGRQPREPTADVTPYVSRLAPLPFVMLQASGDRSVPLAEAREVFSAARDPRRLTVVAADNHRFDSGRAEFYRSLRDGLAWIDRGGR